MHQPCTAVVIEEHEDSMLVNTVNKSCEGTSCERSNLRSKKRQRIDDVIDDSNKRGRLHAEIFDAKSYQHQSTKDVSHFDWSTTSGEAGKAVEASMEENGSRAAI